MPWYSDVAKPKSLLGYHRILSPAAGARVSPLCLGTMNFGNSWKVVFSYSETLTMVDANPH